MEPMEMEVNVRIAGAAGQGIQTTAEGLGTVATRAGLFAHCHVDAESRIRGGLNFSHLRLAERPRAGVVDRVDVLVAHTPHAAEVLGTELAEGAVLLTQEETEDPRAAPFPLGRLAREAGTERASGTVALGVLCQLLGIDLKIAEGMLRERFARKAGAVEANLAAVRRGAEAAREWHAAGRFRLRCPGTSDRLWLAGSEAVAVGAVAAGVGFFASYPMSPATGIMAHLATLSHEYPGVEVYVEQAEDEVAAINMVAGAAFAGARSMTATSGGGYCLMTEGVSLLGMIEAPAVIALSQRPGPATGLPTRQAQGDLQLARHGGHGCFPRILLAPQSIPDAVEVTALAFDLAERFQTPVYVLTDQHLNDSRVTCAPPTTSHLPRRRHLLTGEELAAAREYRRYAWSDDGISPVALPGKSRHLVYADSDEHDEWGHPTEAAPLAEQMARKRLAKAAAVAAAAWPTHGAAEAGEADLVLSWGSTWETVAEALEGIGGEPDHLHLRWLWPLGSDVRAAVERAHRILVIENHVEAGLADLLQEATPRRVDARITKLDGRPFTVGELRKRLGEELEG